MTVLNNETIIYCSLPFNDTLHIIRKELGDISFENIKGKLWDTLLVLIFFKVYISILSFFAIIAKIINCIYSYYSVEVYDNITKSIFTNNSNDAYEYSFSKILLSILDIISNSIVNDIYLIYLFLIN